MTDITIPITFPPGPARSYDVLVGDGLLSRIGPLVRARLNARRAFCVIDDALPMALVEPACRSLRDSGFEVTESRVRASEAEKTIDTAARLLAEIAATPHERSEPVIAIGGGVTGDIAGFVAATWRRGVPIVQCPTTLLSMVDASVGGKTGVNVHAGGELRKNMVGAFWQPRLVVADVAGLASLPTRHIRCGLAECLKHGLISHASDPDLFRWTTDALPRILHAEQGALTDLIARNVRVKAGFVQHDEREEQPSSVGGRALLNLGHTFGHALETNPALSSDGAAESAPLQHGEAVALGLVAAAATSHALGRLSEGDVAAIRAAVERAGLPTRVRGLPPDEAIIATMFHDKKVRGGRLRLVLPTAIGACVVVEGPRQEAISAGLRAIRV